MRRNLVIDVGMHDGMDTAAYLAAGYEVVAIEANPDMVAAGMQRFADHIAAGRLTILPYAVAPQAGCIELAIFDDNTGWTTCSAAFIKRNTARIPCRRIKVPART